MPQYWWAISWAKILAISCASKRLMSPTSGSKASLVMNMVAGGAWPKP